MIAVEKGARLINMDAQAPNQVFGEWVRAGKFVPDLTLLRPEQKYGNSRFDFYWEAPGRRGFVEVKGVTLEENGVVRFPDAPTLRGVKHLEELRRHTGTAMRRLCALWFKWRAFVGLSPMTKPIRSLDRLFAKRYRQGVQVMALECAVKPDWLKITGPVKVWLGQEN